MLDLIQERLGERLRFENGETRSEPLENEILQDESLLIEGS